MRHVLTTLGRVISSYGLAVIILILLMVLTGLGTFEQTHASIYDVQRKYFDGLLVVRPEPVEGVRLPIVLPGGTLLLALLFVNLVAGGLVRIKKRATKVFIIITHLGILWLLAAGLVEFLYSTKGNLALYEGETGDEYQSYFDWDVVVVEHLKDGRVREHVLPSGRFSGLDPGETALFTAGALPFDLRVGGYERNAGVAPAPVGGGADGVLLVPLVREREKAERNVPGLLLTAVEKSPGGRTHRSVLHGAQRFPWQIQVGAGADARTYDFDLRRRRWPVPYGLQLDRFVVRYHPGTQSPQEYSSYVTQLGEASARPIHITMNQPLRDRGFTFFQSSFDTPRELPDGSVTPWTSVFAVVHNPADQWPKWACWVIGFGLFWHMVWKLVLYITAEVRRRNA